MYSGVKVTRRENKDLARKLKKHRKIALLNDSKLLKLASPVRKFFSILLKIFTAFLLVFAGLFVYSIINARRNGVVPRFAGLSLEQVISGSMVASGLNKGDNVLVYKVDPHTLKVGDIVVFYQYSPDGSKYSPMYKTANTDGYGHVQYSVTIDDFLGKIEPNHLVAARANSKLIIHHIISIQQDSTGKWWFTTHGSSNPSNQVEHFSEDYVIGYYNQSVISDIFGKTLNFITSFAGIMVIVGVPLVLLAFVVLSSVFNHIQLTLLEEEVINGERPVSDPVCVKNKIGRNLSKQDKFYLLARANEEERSELLPYLYEDGAVPNAINKYYHRKKLMMMPIYEIKSLQQKAQEQYNSGVPISKVMKEYAKDKEELLSKHENYRVMFKEQDKAKHPIELIALKKSKKAKRLVEENDNSKPQIKKTTKKKKTSK